MLHPTLYYTFLCFRKYKNIVPQEVGINVHVIKWMDAAWKELGATSFQRTGGLLGDEMTIQVD